MDTLRHLNKCITTLDKVIGRLDLIVEKCGSLEPLNDLNVTQAAAHCRIAMAILQGVGVTFSMEDEISQENYHRLKRQARSLSEEELEDISGLPTDLQQWIREHHDKYRS